MKKRITALAAAMLLMSACGTAQQNTSVQETSQEAVAEDMSAYDFTVSYDGLPKGNVSSGASVHDPSILKVGDTYYIYGSHMSCASCKDLKTWRFVAAGYRESNTVFGQIYSVYDKAFAYAGSPKSIIPTDDAAKGGGEHVWAPDVIYNKAMGKYVMYYCTTSTWNASNLCYGISDSPEGPFEWQEALIYSGFDKETIEHTDVLDYVDRDFAEKTYLKGPNYRFEDWPNAIDPSVFYDLEGKMHMVYGSWSGGIFLLDIDEQTGKVIHPEADPENSVDAYFGKRLAGGGHMSMEGPYILPDPDTGKYYLFVSYGGLNSTGGYQIRVFRSDKVDGEYTDMYGRTLDSGLNNAYFGLKLSGNYMLPSLSKAYMATGHNSALIDEDGRKYIVYHTRFDDGSEMHSPRVHQYLLNKEQWPCMLPYQFQDERVSESGYTKEEVTGRYYFINQGTAIDAKIAEPAIIYLREDGTVIGENTSGTWEAAEGTYYVNINIGETEYSGVFCAMNDEAGTPVMTFSAVGNNESIWGVKYLG